MQLAMRKSSTTTSKKQAGMKEPLKRPQRGLGVAELERIRLQEEQEERLLYHSSHHHLKLHPQAVDSHYSLQYKQLHVFSNHLPFNPNFNISPNPNFMNPNPNSNVDSPSCNPPPFIAFPPQPTKPATLSPTLHANPNLNPALVITNPICSNSSDIMPSHSSSAAQPTKPGLMTTPPSPYKDHSDFLLPYAITAQNSPSFANPSFAPNLSFNPNIAPFHNTNPNLKIPNVMNTHPQVWLNSALMEHSFLPLLSSSFQAADDITQTFQAADGGFCEAPLYHDHFMFLAGSDPSVENPPSLTDSSLNSPASIHEHNCKALQKNMPALQDAEELELPSFQSMVFKKQQQSISCGYEKQYMRCNLDLNKSHGEYELAYNAKINPRTKNISSRGTLTFGVDTSPRDGFLKLGLPTITEEWNQGSMQTKILEHFHERTMNPRIERHYGQMVKKNKPNIDLELKLSLPSFGYQ